MTTKEDGIGTDSNNPTFYMLVTRVHMIGLTSGFLAGFSTGILATIYCFYRINKAGLQNVIMKALLQK
jgi:hypothetical protein